MSASSSRERGAYQAPQSSFIPSGTTTTTPTNDRLAALSSHLSAPSASATRTQDQQHPPPPPPAAANMAASRPPITCHVLDTTSGRPAAGIAVTLTLVSTTGGSAVGTGSFYAGTTDGDGRVTEWAAAGGAALADVFAKLREEGGGAAGPSSWALRFETGPYYDAKGVEPFYPEVELRFVVRRPEEHFHVPLLLGPYSYTTYRGS